MSEEKHSPCRLCDLITVLIDGIFCDSCYDMIERIKYHVWLDDGFTIKVTTTERKINGLRRIR